MIRSRIARLLRSVADKLDRPGFEYRLDFADPGNVVDWSKVADEMKWLTNRR